VDDILIRLAQVQGERMAPRWERPVSLEVPRGTLHLIKTRSAWSAPLMRLCLGFSEPVSGTIHVQGVEPWALGRGEAHALRRTMSAVLDPDGLVANMTLRMNLVTPLVYATGLATQEAEERADRTLDIMHLTMWAQTRPAALPAEVRQTAALARALASQQPLMLLENPLASVDTRETRRLLSLCRAQCETLLIATHRKDSILHEFADAVWDWDDDGFRVAA
jgi:ABC-type transporter Mla maintaining outer membrane lipid asymmetry ATPase subunit MlaF